MAPCKSQKKHTKKNVHVFLVIELLISLNGYIRVWINAFSWKTDAFMYFLFNCTICSSLVLNWLISQHCYRSWLYVNHVKNTGLTVDEKIHRYIIVHLWYIMFIHCSLVLLFSVWCTKQEYRLIAQITQRAWDLGQMNCGICENGLIMTIMWA